MLTQPWLRVVLTLFIIFLLGLPMGRYMARVAMGGQTRLDRLFDPDS